MENGAHFYRCDFQVHTPRDLNWNGVCPISIEDRKRYADDFIAACRKKGLHAVAITDHHDTAFYSYIKEAAQSELDDDGNLVDENRRIVIFPGMELTLGVPCQALLLFDANFPADLLATIPPILAVTPNDPSLAKHAGVNRLDNIKNIKALCDDLDERDYLKGRYILLPNVGENGDFSLLGKGFASHYKEMPCVGGYVDGSLEKLGTGNRRILQGGAKEYGFKRLGVFQTSDNRSADFTNLGQHTSWVKWTVPSAEALRQACLAQDTRISNTEPQLPALIIQTLEVSNSKFLGPITISFNPQLNCLIGGRGTGKSTVLEYLRWALCDQPPAQVVDEEELPDFQKKRALLIENTLTPLEAVVTLTFLLNKIPHVVRRSAKTKQLLLKVGNGEFRECHEETIRDLLPVQAYSQKQLSTIGVRTDELIRFVKIPISKNLREFNSQQEGIKTKLRTSYLKMQAKLVLNHEIQKDKFEIDSLTQQVQNLRLELRGLTEEDQKILAHRDLMLDDERLVQELGAVIANWREQISTVLNPLSYPNNLRRLLRSLRTKIKLKNFIAVYRVFIKPLLDISHKLQLRFRKNSSLSPQFAHLSIISKNNSSFIMRNTRRPRPGQPPMQANWMQSHKLRGELGCCEMVFLRRRNSYCDMATRTRNTQMQERNVTKFMRPAPML